MNRTIFDISDYGRCVALTTPAGITREFHIQNNGGYVREGSNSGFQVCDFLSHSGNTLSATPETLGAVIRREWRRRQRNTDMRAYDQSIAE